MAKESSQAKFLKFTKLTFSVGLLVLFFHLVDWSQVLKQLNTLKAWTLVALLVLKTVSVCLGAMRWKRLLVTSGISFSFLDAVREILIGSFYNHLLPSSLGGDVVRGIRVGSQTTSSGGVWATIGLERLFGLFALGLFPIGGVLSYFSSDASSYFLPVALSMGAVAVLIAWLHVPIGFLASKVGFESIRRVLLDTYDALTGPLRHWIVRLECLLYSLFIHAINFMMLIVVVVQFNEPITAVIIGVPIALIGSMLPITIGGLGLRESLFVTILPTLGLSAELSGLLAGVWLASGVFGGLAGAIVFTRSAGRVGTKRLISDEARHGKPVQKEQRDD